MATPQKKAEVSAEVTPEAVALSAEMQKLVEAQTAEKNALVKELVAAKACEREASLAFSQATTAEDKAANKKFLDEVVENYNKLLTRQLKLPHLHQLALEAAYENSQKAAAADTPVKDTKDTLFH